MNFNMADNMQQIAWDEAKFIISASSIGLIPLQMKPDVALFSD